MFIDKGCGFLLGQYGSQGISFCLTNAMENLSASMFTCSEGAAGFVDQACRALEMSHCNSPNIIEGLFLLLKFGVQYLKLDFLCASNPPTVFL